MWLYHLCAFFLFVSATTGKYHTKLLSPIVQKLEENIASTIKKRTNGYNTATVSSDACKAAVDKIRENERMELETIQENLKNKEEEFNEIIGAVTRGDVPDCSHVFNDLHTTADIAMDEIKQCTSDALAKADKANVNNDTGTNKGIAEYVALQKKASMCRHEFKDRPFAKTRTIMCLLRVKIKLSLTGALRISKKKENVQKPLDDVIAKHVACTTKILAAYAQISANLGSSTKNCLGR